MRRSAVALGLVLTIGALGGCSGSGGASSGTAKSASGGRAAAGPALAGRAASAASAPQGVRAAAGGTAGGTGGAAAGTVGDGAAAPVLDDGSAKIRTAELSVAVDGYQHVAALADRADDIAVQAGGEIDSDDRTSGHYASAAIKLRVPPDQLQTVLGALSRLGTEQSRSSSTTDVTERVADVTSRLSSARESIARLRQLYAGATKVADVIAVEGELSTREADLESLEAQQRSLARQTAMASVSLSLQTAARHVAPPKKHTDRGGFLGGLQHGWDGFVGAAVWISAAVGVLLPFALVLFVLGLAARVLGVRMPARMFGRGGGPSPTRTPVPSD